MKGIVKLSDIQSLISEKKPVLKFAPNRDNLATILLGMPAPRVNDKNIFTVLMLQKFLQQELWNKVREESAFSYNLQVTYSCYNETTSPNLTVYFQTLPNDAGAAIATVVAVLQKISLSGVSAEQMSSIIEKERKRREILNKSPQYLTDRAAMKGLFKEDWIGDSEAYFSGLSKVTAQDISEFVTLQLPLLKVSVSGPAPTNETLQAINQLNLTAESQPEIL